MISKIIYKIVIVLIKINYISYFDVYEFLYEKINSKKLSSKKIIELQEFILYMVEQLNEDKQKYGDDSDYDYNYLVEVFRMLVNNILNVYVIESDVTVNRNLTLSQYKNDNFDRLNIKEYILKAKELLKENKNSFIVITDLCMGNIEWGDIILRIDKVVKSIEIKESTPKNKDIMKAVELYDVNPFVDKHDREHFDRLKKQIIKHKTIENNLQSNLCFFEDDGLGITLPYNLDNISKYSNTFYNIICEADKQLFKKIIIDECIAIYSIDLETFNLLCDENQDVCSICNHLSKRNNYVINEDNVIEAFEFMSEPINEYNKFLYNDVVQEAFMPQPYLIDIPGNMMKKIIMGRIAVFITVDIDKLFDILRKKGYKIYSKKGAKTYSNLYYKNKNWIFSSGDVKGYFGLSLIHRLSYGFYTTEGLCDFIEKYLIPIQKDIEAEA